MPAISKCNTHKRALKSAIGCDTMTCYVAAACMFCRSQMRNKVHSMFVSHVLASPLYRRVGFGTAASGACDE